MSEKTGIQWCDHTFNPWWGCVKVSEACKHCYAATLATRYGHDVWGAESPRRFFGEKHWREPLAWNAKAAKDGIRRRVFCASMADVFEDRPDLIEPRARLFQVVEDTPALDWLLLTKRPEHITRLMPKCGAGELWPNVWLGTTAETQDRAMERLPYLVKVPAVVRFVSYEPALGPVSFLRFGCDLDWIIAGGESGAGCRPPDPDWMRSVRDQCQAAGISFFFKQWGGFHPKAHGAELDGREWKEFPRCGA